MKNNKEKKPFSKALLIQESILIWIITLSFIFLTFICIMQGFTGELPWITGVAGFAWTAYGVSQACYYKKSEKENTQGGIVFETALREFKDKIEEVFEENVNTEETEEAAG
jgi:hypothetical protein